MILPRWVLRIGWAIHKGLFATSGGRIGAERPRDGKVGTLFLLSTGRKSGTVRRNALFYLEDGPNLVVVASNAGAEPDPSWWLNLKAHPNAAVQLGPRRCFVYARAATTEEHGRLWPRLVAASPAYDEYRRAASRPIPVVVLEPTSEVRG